MSYLCRGLGTLAALLLVGCSGGAALEPIDAGLDAEGGPATVSVYVYGDDASEPACIANDVCTPD